jgi:TonB family protein
MKRECDAIRPLLGAFADKELDAAQADRVRQHLATCTDCPRELAQIEQLHKLVKGVEHPRLAEDYWHWHRARVWRGIRNVTRRRMPTFRPSFAWTRFATVAAGLAVVLVVVIGGWRMFGERQLLTGRGMVAERTLAQPQAAVPPAALKRPVTVATEEKVATAEALRDEAEVSASGGSATGVRLDESADKTASGLAGKTVKADGLVRTESEPPPARAAATDEVNLAPPAARIGSANDHEPAFAMKGSRIVTGPVLLESPPMPDLDILDTGTVLLNVTTDSIGRVLSAAVRRSSGSARLDSVAVRQIRWSRFKAAVQDSRSVPISFEYPFRFQKKQAEKQKEPDQDDQQDKQDDQKQEKPPKEKTNK